MQDINGGAIRHADEGVKKHLCRNNDWGKEIEGDGDDCQEWREKRVGERAEKPGEIGYR